MPDSTAILFRLMDFYCDALMYFHSGVDSENSTLWRLCLRL